MTADDLASWTDRGRVTIQTRGDEPAWLAPTLERLGEILQLPEDWSSHGARRVKVGSVASALDVLRKTMLDDTPAPSIVPTSCGGVQLEWHMRGIDLEIGVPPRRSITAAYEDATEGVRWEEEDGVSLDRLTNALAELTRRA